MRKYSLTVSYRLRFSTVNPPGTVADTAATSTRVRPGRILLDAVRFPTKLRLLRSDRGADAIRRPLCRPSMPNCAQVCAMSRANAEWLIGSALDHGSGSLRQEAHAMSLAGAARRSTYSCAWSPARRHGGRPLCSLLLGQDRVDLADRLGQAPSMPMARTCSMASVLGKAVSTDIRVRPAPIASIRTRAMPCGRSMFGEPSSLAKPGRNARP